MHHDKTTLMIVYLSWHICHLLLLLLLLLLLYNIKNVDDMFMLRVYISSLIAHMIALPLKILQHKAYEEYMDKFASQIAWTE
jgi:hypothetical protein